VSVPSAAVPATGTGPASGGGHARTLARRRLEQAPWWGPVRRYDILKEGAIALVVVAVLVAVLVGWLVGSFGPVGNSGARVVERDRTTPPLDVRLTASPLSEFRVFKVQLKDSPLFGVHGAGSGLPVRIATMDYWDGGTWQTAPADLSAQEAFERVSGSLPVDGASGPVRTVTISLDPAWANQVWIPMAGVVTAVTFSGAQSASLLNGLRYDVATGTLAEPGGLVAGSTIAETTSGPGSPSPRTSVPIVVPPELSSAIGKLQSSSSCPGRTVQELNCVAHFMKKEGILSDGSPGPNSLAGATADRLANLASGLGELPTQSATKTAYPTGDGEQFAALLGVVAAQQGFPVHVDVGVRDAQDGVVHGRDLTAWTEVYDGTKWVMLADPVPTQTSVPTIPPQNQQVDPVPIEGPHSVVPPLQNHETLSACAKSVKSAECQAKHSSGFNLGLPGWVAPVVGVPLSIILLFVLVTASLMGIKLSRRNRRRRSGAPAERVSAGWRELSDVIRDAGWILPTNATRRESAVLLGRTGVSRMARQADTILFGPEVVTPDSADSYWGEVDATSAALLSSLSRFDRWKARVNITSFGVGDRVEAEVTRVKRTVKSADAWVRRWLGRTTG